MATVTYYAVIYYLSVKGLSHEGTHEMVLTLNDTA